eukprot:TRINITY_DN6587_c0_g1_i1.p1 TRINITY_DN6587_c0_g1~~TRINITY_DN6587_c0_g1_i1.p1  ORF type:complete len:701 (+),score=140.76 TRINITY_DN6587_c0_g1_i1:147-2249(+)
MAEDSKIKQLEEFTDNVHKGCPITTNFGVKISNTDTSLKVGDRGPTLIEDFHFREKISHFDHERIPERVVHARGTAAHGFFQVYKSQEAITKAHFLNDPNHKTPVFVRFSTVLGSRGSADTVRDVRGFATKFYTQEGNFDLVGNNIPIFFIQDAMKFPDVIHAGKPEPNNEVPQAQTAHNNFWDFISLVPETSAMSLWTLSDRALPRSFQSMQGFGVHTFVLVNKEGVRRFVKFHWKPLLGLQGLVWDESQKLQGVDPDFHRKELYDAIERGDFPQWELGLQVVDAADEDKFPFDLLDPTKFIPEDQVPVQYIGKMTLNRLPDDFFAEAEQVAFCTQHIVPGIDFSDDPLLQGRNFSYQDTQLTRLGGPNFQEIPINRPICPVFNNQRDGFMRTRIQKGKVNYFPNREGFPEPVPPNRGGFETYHEKIAGMKERMRGPKFNDHFSQGSLFFNSLTPVEQQRVIFAAVFELSHTDEAIQKKVLENFVRMSKYLSDHVAQGLGLEPPHPPHGWVYPDQKSKFLSMVDGPYVVKSPKSKKVAVLVSDGYNNNELDGLLKALKDVEAVPFIVGSHSGTVKGQHGHSVKADFSLFTIKSTAFDAVFIVGGESSVKGISLLGESVAFINEAFKHCKPIGAIGPAVEFLQKKATFPPEIKFSDGNKVVDSFGVVTLLESNIQIIVREFIEAVGVRRFWERNVASVPA